MTFKLDGENPPGILSEVEICRCAPLNQCDTKSWSPTRILMALVW